MLLVILIKQLGFVSATYSKISIFFVSAKGSPPLTKIIFKFGTSFFIFCIDLLDILVSFPLSLPNLNQTLLKLDEKVLSAGGRIYLAKDSMQSSEMFKKTYPRLDEWKEVKNKMDPKNIFCSDLSKRLNIF